MVYKHHFGIITGSNDAHFPYLVACLNTLSVFNDMSAPIAVLDFGLSAENLAALNKYNNVTYVCETRSFDSELTPITKIIGAEKYYYFRYVFNTYKKLAISHFKEFEYFLWIDADCLLLTKLSGIIPEYVPGKFVAARDGRADLDAQFIDENPIVRQAMAAHLKTQFGNPPTSRVCFNSGVLFSQHEYYRTIYTQFRDSVLYRYGSHLYGDQSLLNIGVSLRQEEIGHFRPTINMSVSEGKNIELCSLSIGDQNYCTISIDKIIPEVYHFLGYKPLTKVDPDFPAQRLFDFWLGKSPIFSSAL